MMWCRVRFKLMWNQIGCVDEGSASIAKSLPRSLPAKRFGYDALPSSAHPMPLAGHGLKAPDTAIKQSTSPMMTVDATMAAVKKAILDNMVG